MSLKRNITIDYNLKSMPLYTYIYIFIENINVPFMPFVAKTVLDERIAVPV